MNILRSIAFLVRADFLERVRRYNFLIVLGLTAVAGYSMVPGVDESYGAFLVGGCRGIYNAAWIGTTFGTVVATLVSLLGFFVVKNAVTRDYETRLGQIIAASRVSTLQYMIGKWLSNLAVLLVMLAVLTVLALAMLILRRETPGLDFPGLVTPIWMMGLPVFALVAAVAVLFESISILRYGLGNFLYTLLWVGMLLVMVGPMFTSPGSVGPSNDLPGLSATMADICAQMDKAGLDPNEGVSDLYVPLEGQPPRTFVWNGIGWTPRIVGQRLLWVGVAFLIVLLAALPFDRFDPARATARRRKQRKPEKADGRLARLFARFSASERSPIDAYDAVVATELTPIRNRRLHLSLLNLAWWEFRLLWKGRSRWWYVGAATIIVMSLFLPDAVLKRFFVPLAWIWPILLWSGMGSAETRYRTKAFVYPTPRSPWVQLVPVWLAGVAVAGILTAGAAVHSVVVGDPAQTLGYVAGCLFVPALALGLGVVTGNGRLFEMVYAFLWLFGVYGKARPLDFLGKLEGSFGAGVPVYFLAIGALMLLIAVTRHGRRARFAND